MTRDWEKDLREKTRARAFQIRDQIAIVLENQGMKVDSNDHSYGIGAGIYRLDDTTVDLVIKSQYSNIGMTGICNGKLSLSFGHYGKRRTYPEPNAGYNVNKLCAHLTEWLSRQKQLNETENKRQEELNQLKMKVEELEPQLKKLGFISKVNWTGRIDISRTFDSPQALALFLQRLGRKKDLWGEKHKT